MISILLVEHPPAVRRTLRDRVSIEPDMEVVGEAGDGLSAAALAEALQPDVVLLDAEMPHLDVKEVVRLLRECSPCGTAVILSLHATAVYQALGAGAALVVGKDEGAAALLAAIRRAAARRHRA